MIITKLTIVNGHRHGDVLEIEGERINGDVINSVAPSKIRRVGDDADIRYAHPMFTDKFRVLGEFAYYIGQTMPEPWFD